MRTITVTAGPLAGASANAICLSQTPNAGALTLNGSLVTSGVAVLDAPRQVLFTFAANETGHSFVVTGTNWAGDTISETVAGTTAGTVATVLSYKRVTSITISANATGAMTVGTNGVGESQWVRLDHWALPTTTIQTNVSGSATYTIMGSNDDPNSPTNVVGVTSMSWVNCPDLSAVSATGGLQLVYPTTPAWLKLQISTGTGTVTMTVSQSGSVTY